MSYVHRVPSLLGGIGAGGNMQVSARAYKTFDRTREIKLELDSDESIVSIEAKIQDKGQH